MDKTAVIQTRRDDSSVGVLQHQALCRETYDELHAIGGSFHEITKSKEPGEARATRAKDAISDSSSKINKPESMQAYNPESPLRRLVMTEVAPSDQWGSTYRWSSPNGM